MPKTSAELDLAAVLFCQHPEVCKLQKLKDRIIWLAQHSKPESRRPFKPSSTEAKALRSNPLVVDFESAPGSLDHRSKMNKDQRMHVLHYVWMHDCLGHADFAFKGAQQLARAQAKSKQMALQKEKNASRKAAHDEAIKRLRIQQVLQQVDRKKVSAAAAAAAAAADPDPALKSRLKRGRVIDDSDDESEDEATCESKMLMNMVGVLEAKVATVAVDKEGPLMKRIRRLAGITAN